MAFTSLPRVTGGLGWTVSIGTRPAESKCPAMLARVRSSTQPRGGLVGVQRQDLVTDPQIPHGLVLRAEIEADVDLVRVEHAEAGRHHHLGVADGLEPF